jgi:NAD-reducing hydrogenase small subunit
MSVSTIQNPAPARKIRLATVWLDGCAGCHMSVLDIDEALLLVAQKADIVYGPLVDAQEFPEGVDVTLVEGAVSSHEDLRLLHKARSRTKLLIALGDCAVTSNVPSMRNSIPVSTMLQRIYVDGVQQSAGVPGEGVPGLLRHARPMHDFVKVDLHIPGCPPGAKAIFAVLADLLEGRKPDLANKVKFG